MLNMFFADRTPHKSGKGVTDAHNEHGGLQYPLMGLPEKKNLKQKNKRKQKWSITFNCRRLNIIVFGKSKQRAKPFESDIKPVEEQKNKCCKRRVKAGVEIGWHKENDDTHAEMSNFSDYKTADTEFSCEKFSKKNKQQNKA